LGNDAGNGLKRGHFNETYLGKLFSLADSKIKNYFIGRPAFRRLLVVQMHRTYLEESLNVELFHISQHPLTFLVFECEA
jgi:hypothetical protein